MQKSRNTWSNRQVWPRSTQWSRAKANRVLSREHIGNSKRPFPETQEMTLYMDISKWSILKLYWLCSLQLTHLKNKTLMLGMIEGGRRRGRQGWDSWMASPTQWTWVWGNSGRWWWTGRPGVLQFMGSQRVRHDWVTELNWTEWLNCFPHFPQFKPEFFNKEFMIWATVSSRSCFCWLYRASPS